MSTLGWIATIIVGGVVVTTLAPVIIFGAVAHAGINALRNANPPLIKDSTTGLVTPSH